MPPTRKERILILAKTYPSPSARYVETSCVAGITQDGAMRRLYPIPFRLITDAQQFRKWQWVEVTVEQAPNDHRPESHKVDVGSLICGERIDTQHGWEARLQWLTRVPTFDGLGALNQAQTRSQLSLAVLRPTQVLGLEITKARHADWTEEEKAKLLQQQTQGQLFDPHEERRQMVTLRKVPFDFYFHHACTGPEGVQHHKSKIVDWEVGALYWNCVRSHGPRWELPFRDKLERQLADRTRLFLMGNQHRFRDQWLIIGLIYPPKPPAQKNPQADLF